MCNTSIIDCCRRACKARSICSESSTVGTAAAAAVVAAAAPSRRASVRLAPAASGAAATGAAARGTAASGAAQAALLRAVLLRAVLLGAVLLRAVLLGAVLLRVALRWHQPSVHLQAQPPAQSLSLRSRCHAPGILSPETCCKRQKGSLRSHGSALSLHHKGCNVRG